MALAIDHRSQLEELAGRDARKDLGIQAAGGDGGDAGREGGRAIGMLLDDKYGRDALFDAGQVGNLWIGKPIELPGSRPLRFEFSQDLGSRLIDWPVEHCIKVLCFYHPDDAPALKREQIDRLRQAQDAARKVGRELLIEIIAGKHGSLDDGTVARILGELYDAGLKPDWWKLEPQASPRAWEEIDRVIEDRDSYLPWGSAAGARCAGGRPRAGFCGRAAGADGQGLCGRSDDLCAGGGRLAGRPDRR